MKYGTRSGNAAKARSQCTVVGIYDDGSLTETGKQLDKESKGYLKKIIKRGDIKGKANQTQLLHDVPTSVPPVCCLSVSATPRQWKLPGMLALAAP